MKKEKPITLRQQQILSYMTSRAQELGYWPSVREIQQEFNYKSTNAVMNHLRALQKKGYLLRVRGQARAFVVPHKSPFGHLPGDALTVVDVPVLGNIAAGFPERIESGGEVSRIQVDTFTAGIRRHRPTFAIRVRGESMINAGINDGDTVVVESREPQDGDIVAALIDGETTLKRFIRNGPGTPYLKAENKAYPELYPVDELIVQGVATAVVKKL